MQISSTVYKLIGYTLFAMRVVYASTVDVTAHSRCIERADTRLYYVAAPTFGTAFVIRNNERDTTHNILRGLCNDVMVNNVLTEISV